MSKSNQNQNSQDTVFLKSEGNQWFNRNAAAIQSKKRVDEDIPLRILSLYSDLQPKKVLEIGCSNGYRLSEVQKKYGSICVGVEPSSSAIENGRSLYPNINFKQGVAAELPIQNEQFDLVMMCFVFHWIDRATLLKSVSEVDRVLAPGGYLLVGDFFPNVPEKRKYHHLPEQNLHTYKQDYTQTFLSSGLYVEICRLTFDQDTATMVANTESSRRGSHALLKKLDSGIYVGT